MSRAIPSLSTTGWLYEVSAKLDYELGCIASTDALQSNTFSNLVSLPAIIQANKNDIVNTASEVRRMVLEKLSRVFDDVQVEARYDLVDPTESQTLSKITLSINFTEGGKPYSAGRILTFYNGKFKEISEANNG